MYKFSVVIPVYNVENYLEECLDSILNQGLDYSEYEIICVNDGSTDSSLDILKKYKEKYENIKIVCQENSGLSQTRNTGINNAEGEYLLFIDSDDKLEENSLSYIYEKCKINELDGYFFDGKVFFDDVDAYKSKFNTDTYNRKKDYGIYSSGTELFYKCLQDKKMLINVQLCAIKTKIIKENNLSFVDKLIHEDEVYTLTLIKYLGKVMHENKLFYERRVREGSIMTSTDAIIHIKNYFKVIENLEKELTSTKDKFQREILLFKITQTIRAIAQYIRTLDNPSIVKEEIKNINILMKKYNFFNLKTAIIWYSSKNIIGRNILKITSK